jgi:hypothetical protein
MMMVSNLFARAFLLMGVLTMARRHFAAGENRLLHRETTAQRTPQ